MRLPYTRIYLVTQRQVKARMAPRFCRGNLLSVFFRQACVRRDFFLASVSCELKPKRSAVDEQDNEGGVSSWRESGAD